MRVFWLLPTLFFPLIAAADPLHKERHLFNKDSGHGHVHGASIAQLADGSLIAAWYENGPALPDPYYNEDRDKSANVRIGGARLQTGADSWGETFVMADTFGVSDNNAALSVDAENRLWLVYPTLLGVPEWSWGSALVRYHLADAPTGAGAPQWNYSNVLVVQPQGFEAVIEKTQEKWSTELEAAGESALLQRALGYLKQMKERLDEPLVQRLGWMPRAHPMLRRDGAMLLPLSNENFNIAVMAITADSGRTWTFSEPVPEVGLTQPTLAEFEDGEILAFFRNGGPEKRIKRSASKDGGITWSEVTTTDLVHPGAGIEAITLDNGHLLMIYNDVESSPRDQLAVSISDDRGATWKWTRHLENTEGGRFDYPSIIQAADGSLHAVYSFNLETIKHVHFNEAWVQAEE